MNPSVTSVPVTDTPTLVFSGTGKVRISALSGGPVYGDSSLSYANAGTHMATSAGMTFEFCAPAEIYAVHPTGQSGNVRVEHWY